ncbi:unnamed protein product [Phytophthora lilii]|uniref:Unnamed protein product n=1 Tax=Phytophthora lilii TaxID=2077276 RepID=A0A9W6XAD6_9STRA|nr:unnamed protein product [Phytophthora lilii]
MIGMNPSETASLDFDPDRFTFAGPDIQGLAPIHYRDPAAVRHTHRLPDAILYQNPNNAPLYPCATCGKPVRSDLRNINCHRHRNNRVPEEGWGHLTAQEFELINFVRQYRFHDRVFDLLDAIVSADDGSNTSDEESNSIVSLTDAADDMRLESGDELLSHGDTKVVNRTEPVRTTADNSGETRRTNRSSGRGSRRRFQLSSDSSDDDDESNEFTGDGGAQMNEYLRQIREVTETEMQNVTPRIEVAMHRPLGQIKVFSGLRNKSENSMQWLRAFVYEMKGTRASPDEWYMPFELSLWDGALHWYRQLPKKTKRQWSLLSVAFIKRLCHIRVKDIHELEEMIMDILKIDERKSTRESSQHHSRSRDSTCRREERRREDSRDHYSRRDRRDRDYDRRRDDSRNVPRVTLAEVSVTDIFAELQAPDVRSSRGERPRNTQRNIPNSGSEADSDELSDDSRQLVILGVMDILPTEVAVISLQPTTTKDELLPKVHTHVPITEDQGVTQRAETSAEMTAIQH